MGRRKRSYVPKVKGCYECSQRRVNCDRTEPTCEKCHLRGIACSGYGIRYRFHHGSIHITGYRLAESRVSSPFLQEISSSPQPHGSKLALDPPCDNVNSQHKGDVSQDGTLRAQLGSSSHQYAVYCGNTDTELSSPTCILRSSALGYLESWKEFLLSYFSDRIAPEMVVLDDLNNGWRHLVLPIARTDELVLDAVLAASAFHFAGSSTPNQFVANPHEIYSRVIDRLQGRKDLSAYDLRTKQAIILSILVLLVVVMINGCSDFPIIFHMLQSALNAVGGEVGFSDGGEVADFSLRQLHKMRVYAAPLLSQTAGLKALTSEVEESFDCLYYYTRLYPEYLPIFRTIAALRHQACNIYLDRVLDNGNGNGNEHPEAAIRRFVETLKTLPDCSPGKHVLVWPCFIAASGSRMPEHQAFLQTFLEKQYIRNGFANLQRALEVLSKIWACDPEEDWPSLLPQLRVFIM